MPATAAHAVPPHTPFKCTNIRPVAPKGSQFLIGSHGDAIAKASPTPITYTFDPDLEPTPNTYTYTYTYTFALAFDL
jgi:hypothetical protein